jgi:hypothetical protein
VSSKQGVASPSITKAIRDVMQDIQFETLYRLDRMDKAIARTADGLAHVQEQQPAEPPNFSETDVADLIRETEYALRATAEITYE